MSRTLSPTTRLAQGILAADITAQKVAAETGIAYQTLLAYARGEKEITPLHRARLGKYLATNVALVPVADGSRARENDPPFPPVSFRGAVESLTGGGKQPVLVIATHDDSAWQLDGNGGQPLTMTVVEGGATLSLSVTVLQARSTLAGTKLRLLIAQQDKRKAVGLFGFLRTAYHYSPTAPHTAFTFTPATSEASNSS
jgi:hypothetical protein